MNIKAKVSEITHDELVNLFSTAFFGSYNFLATYDEGKYRHLFKFGDAFEDKLARIVMGKGSFIVYDRGSNAEDEPYGDLKSFFNEANGMIGYRVDINAIRKGLNRIFNGQTNDPNMKFKLMRYAIDMMDSDSSEFDMDEADALMQVILFNEVIYG